MDSCRCTCHTWTKRKVHLHYTHHMSLYGTFSFMAAIVFYCYSTCYATRHQLKYKPTSISFTEAAPTGSSQRLMLACVHASWQWLFMSCCGVLGWFFLAWLGGSRRKKLQPVVVLRGSCGQGNLNERNRKSVFSSATPHMTVSWSASREHNFAEKG